MIFWTENILGFVSKFQARKDVRRANTREILQQEKITRKLIFNKVHSGTIPSGPVYLNSIKIEVMTFAGMW